MGVQNAHNIGHRHKYFHTDLELSRLVEGKIVFYCIPVPSSQFEIILKTNELVQNKASQVSKLMWNEKIVWMSEMYIYWAWLSFTTTSLVPGPPSHKVCPTHSYILCLLSNERSAVHITTHQGQRIYLVFKVSWTTFLLCERTVVTVTKTLNK